MLCKFTVKKIILMNSSANKPKSKLLKKLTDHYRLLIINDDTYEEKLNFRLNRLNVYVWASLIIIFLVILTSVLIAFTPLRTYIPGYTVPGLKKKVITLKLKTDSLQTELTANQYYLSQLRKVLNNEISFDEFEKKYKQRSMINPDTLKLAPGKMDSILRKEVAEREKYKTRNNSISNIYNFINPATGNITNKFDLHKKHFAVDIGLKPNTPIKSIADGIVLFSDWSKDTGNTIIIQHAGNIISIYKHNKKLLRKAGDFVKKGEVIAISGNSGEKTTGPHLHFELWIKGNPVNPQNYLSFKK